MTKYIKKPKRNITKNYRKISNMICLLRIYNRLNKSLEKIDGWFK